MRRTIMVDEYDDEYEEDEFEEEEEEYDDEYEEEYEEDEYDADDESTMSPRRKVLLLTLLVFVVGIVGAVAFRRPALHVAKTVTTKENSAESENDDSKQAVDSAPSPIESPPAVHAVPKFTGRIDPVMPEVSTSTRDSRYADFDAAQPATADPFATTTPPPTVSDRYPERPLAPIAPRTERSTRATDDPWRSVAARSNPPDPPTNQVPAASTDNRDSTTHVPAAEVSDRPLTPESEPSVSHVIRDGDTLALLAERYLGDRSRYVEIFEANRQVLASPDLLPIGKEITIPPRSLPTVRPAADLVPIQRTKSSAAANDGLGKTPGTYRVRRNDTLVDIARRIYQDESRYRELYEANRDRLLNPHDLREGLELVVP